MSSNTRHSRHPDDMQTQQSEMQATDASPAAAPPAPVPAETVKPPRRRRQHKRSRNGCYTCKQRHIRCDEQKPICTNCLTRGGACGYPVKATSAANTSLDGSNGGNASSGIVSTSSASSTHPSTAPSFSLPDFGDTWPFDDSILSDALNILESESDLPVRPSAFPFPSPALSTYHNVDPFDTLPVSMPLRSMDLFYHMTHYRILTRSLVPKNPNNACIAMVMQDAGLFRGCVLLTAMHYSWIHGGSLGDIEETYLYHKIEAIRLVNENIGNPESSEMCANVIAALALAESGIGDIATAEAHLNGLFTLINRRKPEEWQGRLHGLFQRLILVAGTFISASKGVDYQPPNLPSPTGPTPQLHNTRPTTGNFSAAQFDATKLSPFYFATPLDYEAANADLEGVAITNALQRLSSLKTTCKGTQPDSLSSSPVSTPPPATSTEGVTVDQELTQVLLLETESYLTSLLFRPDAPPPAMVLSREIYQPPARLTSTNNSPSQQLHQEERTPRAVRTQTMASADSAAALLSFDLNLFSQVNDMTANAVQTSAPSPASSHASVSYTNSIHSGHSAHSFHSVHSVHTPAQQSTQPAQPVHTTAIPPYRGPFHLVPPALLPSASRAWSAGAYLYLHAFLEDLWLPPKAFTFPIFSQHNLPPQSRIDPDLRHWLLDTLCASLERNREAMLIGAYSRELWVWQVLVGAYVVSLTDPEGKSPKTASASYDPNLHGADYFDQRSMSGDSATERPPEYYLGAWFREQMRVWADAVDVHNWSDVKRQAGTVAWPHPSWRGEEILEDLWKRAIDGQGSP